MDPPLERKFRYSAGDLQDNLCLRGLLEAFLLQLFGKPPLCLFPKHFFMVPDVANQCYLPWLLP